MYWKVSDYFYISHFYLLVQKSLISTAFDCTTQYFLNSFILKMNLQTLHKPFCNAKISRRPKDYNNKCPFIFLCHGAGKDYFRLSTLYTYIIRYFCFLEKLGHHVHFENVGNKSVKSGEIYKPDSLCGSLRKVCLRVLVDWMNCGFEQPSALPDFPQHSRKAIHSASGL